MPFDQICKPDIPGPLLVLILKLNKEGPHKQDVFRAPGHQANMKKLIHFLEVVFPSFICFVCHRFPLPSS